MICEISKITKRGTDEFAAKASILLMFRFEYGSLGLERTLAAQDGTAISLPVEGPHPEVPPNRSANAAKVLCGWLLHSKTYLIRFVHLSEAVMCPACLRGLDRWP